MKNGELPRLAEAAFQAFITIDRNLSFQPSLRVSVWLFLSCLANQIG
jgi:hypothetical protein